MSCFARRLVFKKFLCCCDSSAEHVCCIIGCLCLFVSFNHLCNFIPFFCLLTAIPHCLIMIVMALAGGLLIAGISFDKPVLLVLFPWVMVACILLQIIYGVILYVSEQCIASILGLLFSNSDSNGAFTGVVVGYTIIGVFAGFDFLFSLYSLLLISCTVTEIVLEQPESGARDQSKPERTICEEDLDPKRCPSYY